MSADRHPPSPAAHLADTASRRAQVYDLEVWSDADFSLMAFAWIWREIFGTKRSNRGRPRKEAQPRFPVDKFQYRDLERCRRALRAHSEREATRWPFIDLDELRATATTLVACWAGNVPRVGLLLRELAGGVRDLDAQRPQDSSPAPGPSARAFEVPAVRSQLSVPPELAMRFLPGLVHAQLVGDLRLPFPKAETSIFRGGRHAEVFSFREAVVRVVEYQWVRANLSEVMHGASPLTVRGPAVNSRLFAVAALAARDEFGPSDAFALRRGPPWTVRTEVEAEMRAILPVMARIAQERRDLLGGPPPGTEHRNARL